MLTSKKLLVMGILNVTPDSFSDGGKFVRRGQGEARLDDGLETMKRVRTDQKELIDVDSAFNRALQMIDEGADIIDIGGESSGPGSKDVSLEQELARVIPVVKNLKEELLIMRTKVRTEFLPRKAKKVLISVDTYKAEVARQAIEAGADIINDVTALRGDMDDFGQNADFDIHTHSALSGDSNMAKVLARYPHVQVIIMYSKDPTARTTRENVQYEDVIATVRDFLEERVKYGVEQGISRERFIIDPGMGAFVSGDARYSLEILRRLREFEDFGLPILIGASRKGFIGEVLGGLPVAERLEGSLACAAVAVMHGASILRVHDVQETRRLVDMLTAIL